MYPGTASMLLGAIVMIWLLPSHRTIEGVTLDINTLLFATLTIILGFQATIFALFAIIFSNTENLLPEDPWLSKLMSYINLERCILTSLILIFLGSLISLFAFLLWDSQSFDPLNFSISMRMTDDTRCFADCLMSTASILRLFLQHFRFGTSVMNLS